MDYLNFTIKNGECLEWTKALNSEGYARLPPNIKVHREVFFKYNGYYPEVVRHTCDNRKCINPDHLIGGNQLDNVLDRVSRGRSFGHVSEEEIETIKNLRLEKLTYKSIATKLRISWRRVEYVVTKLL